MVLLFYFIFEGRGLAFQDKQSDKTPIKTTKPNNDDNGNKFYYQIQRAHEV